MSYARCPRCSSRIISEKACHSCGENFHKGGKGSGSGRTKQTASSLQSKLSSLEAELEQTRRESNEIVAPVKRGGELDDRSKARLRALNSRVVDLGYQRGKVIAQIRRLRSRERTASKD